jgi:hypothetical protein
MIFMKFVLDIFLQNMLLNVTDSSLSAVTYACMKVVCSWPSGIVPRVSSKVSGIHGSC